MLDRRTAFWMLSFTVPYILALTIDSPVGYDYSEGIIRLMQNALIGFVPICVFGGGALAVMLQIKTEAENPMENTIQVCSVFGLIISLVFLSVAITIDLLVPQWVLTTSSCLFFVIGWATEKMWLKNKNDNYER